MLSIGPAFVLCLVFAATPFTSIQGETIRLTKGSHPWEGSLEVYHSGRWGTVCDDGWTSTNTEVVCRQLGFTGPGSPSYSGSHPKYGLTIWLDEVRCSGHETSIADCRHNSWGNNDCNNENIQVTCKPTVCQQMEATLGSQCQHGGTCVSEGGTFRCDCPPNVTGQFCENDVNECLTDNGGCSHECNNFNSRGYNCSCPSPELIMGPDQHNCISPHAGVTCTSQGMSVRLDKAGLAGIRAEYLMVDGSGPQCSAHDTTDAIFFNLPLNDCGTTRKTDGNEWVYENHIMSGLVTVAGVVSPVRRMNVTVRCRYPRIVHVHQVYHVHAQQLAFHQDSLGEFPVRLDIEQGGQTYTPGGPALVVDPGATLALHFSLQDSHQGLEVFAHTCNATPTANLTATTTRYNLIRDGCVLDSTLQDNRTESGELLTLQAFKFVGADSLVFLHCDVMICNASDVTSRCQQGCLQPSSRRSVESFTFLEERRVSFGPLHVKQAREKGGEEGQESENFMREFETLEMSESK